MRRFNHLAAASALFLLISAQASAQSVPTLGDLRKETDGAMAKVGNGDIEGGLKAFRSLMIIPGAEFDAMLGQLPLQSPAITARFGASFGQEFIKEDRLGDSLVRLTYIHK